MKKTFLFSILMAMMPIFSYAQVEPTIDLKSEESLLILIDSHAKIKNINEVHVHLKRLLSIMEENKDVVARLSGKCNLMKDRTPASSAFEHIKDYCLGIKTNGSIRVYSALRTLPKDDPDAMLVERFRQSVIKSAELFGLSPEEYVISGKF